MGENRTQLAALSDTSCCVVSKAPIPQLQSKTPEHSLVPSLAVLDATGDVSRIQRLLPVHIVQDLSPPSFQSLLCAFLI
jgi:hypothetical protein